MAKEKTGENIQASTVAFTAEQMDLVQKMIEASKNTTNTRGAVSRYSDIRDPKEISTVNVSRFDGKFVIGFKDYNTDPYRKAPKYSISQLDVQRGLKDQPFVTLILSDGEETVEKEVSLISYMDNREKVVCKVVDIEQRDIIDDKGLLGRQGASGMAGAIDEAGNPLAPVSVKAEVKRVERTYMVEVPGFDEPVAFIEAFLA